MEATKEVHGITLPVKEQPLPCPFCGHKASVDFMQDGEKESWFVQCDGCHAYGPLASEEMAVFLWNARYLKKHGKIAPCPFCGGVGVIDFVECYDPDNYEGHGDAFIEEVNIKCSNCEARGPAGGTIAEAIENWNTANK